MEGMAVRAHSVMSTTRMTVPRLLAVIASLVIVAGLLSFSVSRAPVALGASAVALESFQFATIGTQTAGTAFTVTVTALDRRGRAVTSHTGGTLSGLTASPSGTAPTVGSLTWVDGVGTASVTATRSRAGAALRIDFGSKSATSNSFSVLPGPLTDLYFADTRNAFNGQPVDAKFDATISSSLAAQASVKVLATDALGNRKSGVDVTVSSSAGTLSGTGVRSTAGGTPGIAPYGEASFGDLSITPIGTYTLGAAATGISSATSRSFEIVADLALCAGSACKNTGRFVSSTVPQLTYGTISTGTDFDQEVVLTTQFLDSTAASQCTDDDLVFARSTEVRVQEVSENGSGVSAATPSFVVTLIYPKTTLQNLGLASRNADGFNVCLGATYLGEDTTPTPWQAMQTATVATLVDATLVDGTYWGWVPDCSAVASDNPCAALKTKNAGQLQAALGLTKREFAQLGFQSSDLAVVISKPWPWDGKFTMR